MEKSQVCVVFCDNYNEQNVYELIDLGIKTLGGIESFVSKEEKILVKPNFLYPAEAGKTVTTNPAVISAVLRILEEASYSNVKVGDSPANGSSSQAVKKLELDEEHLHGAKVAEMNEEVFVKNPKGKIAKDFYFAKDVAEADAIIGISKMKTHQLEIITGAVKNMYGLICGKRKALGHVKYPTAHKFAKMLVDIHKATPQKLHIMDGVIAMEGNGPASGSPTEMNLIIISKDPIAIDTIFCKLINLDPNLVPTNTMGSVGGLGTMNTDEMEINLVDENRTISKVSIDYIVKKYGKPDFDCMRESGEESKHVLGFVSTLFGDNRKPVIDESKCVKCGICVSHCPVDGKGVDFKNGKDKPPVYDYKKCIRCYCCQELCPQKAISVKNK